jgi:uncharacterized protein with GYD domain
MATLGVWPCVQRVHGLADAVDLLIQHGEGERTLGAMPIYVVLSNFTEKGREDVKGTSERLDRLAPVADKLGVKVLANAITMGQYDVVTVMDAPDDATIAKVIGTVLSRGYVTTQTMRGFTADEFRRITADIG